MLNEPSDLVSAVTSRFVAGARTFTAAFGTTAPVVSVTVPSTDPKVCWAMAGAAHNSMHSSTVRPELEERRLKAETAKAERELNTHLLDLNDGFYPQRVPEFKKQPVKILSILAIRSPVPGESNRQGSKPGGF
jgi:hypothetical protein